MTREAAPEKENRPIGPVLSRVSKGVGIAFWAVLMIVCILHREDFTVAGILNYSPENKLGAAGILLLCFGIKSLTVFLYSGILYAACGIMFPLPWALLVSTLGTIVMATIPYCIGRNSGSNAVEKLTAEHPKLQMLREFQGENEVIVTFFVRMIGLVPGDLAAMYSGASRANYGAFLTGTLLGMVPMILLFCLMGMRADDPTSPIFILSIVIKIVLGVLSAVWFSEWKKKRTQKQKLL